MDVTLIYELQVVWVVCMGAIFFGIVLSFMGFWAVSLIDGQYGAEA